MREKTRVGMFEVNSSSCHSLSVCLDSKNLTYQYIEPDMNGQIEVYVTDSLDDDETHNTVAEKLRYIATYIEYSSEDNEMYEKMKNTLYDLIKEHTGGELVIHGNRHDAYISDWNDYTSIFSDKELLKRFLFLPKSFVETSYNG